MTRLFASCVPLGKRRSDWLRELAASGRAARALGHQFVHPQAAMVLVHPFGDKGAAAGIFLRSWPINRLRWLGPDTGARPRSVPGLESPESPESQKEVRRLEKLPLSGFSGVSGWSWLGGRGPGFIHVWCEARDLVSQRVRSSRSSCSLPNAFRSLFPPPGSRT
jgi:hypothetical protein